nr:MND1-interacting protein 1-like [Ipomoea batatas]
MFSISEYLALVAKLDVTQIEEEKKFKEAAEAGNKRKLECLRLKVELDFQRQKDDLQRLEQDLSILKSSELSADRECILEKWCKKQGANEMLRMEREETQSVKKGKQTIKDNIMKKLTELENALRNARDEVDRVNSAVRMQKWRRAN